MEKALIILKPDAIQRSLIGQVTARLEQKGLKLIGCKMNKLSSEILKEHYAHIADKPFFPGIEKFMMSTPVVIQIWKGFEAINVIRQICGVTNSREAAPGTIRGDFSCSYGSNIIHASDSVEAGETEVRRFFSEDEVFSYDKVIEQYSYSDDEK
jgi:nucleoside-diphosphate kinase